MKNKKSKLSFLAFCMVVTMAAQLRYVNSGAVGGGDGLSDATAWTAQESFTNAVPGQTIYFKAGNYGSPINLVFTTDGTVNNRIVFEGYKSVIGDIVATNGNTLYTGGAVDVAEAPSFVGTITTNRPDQDTGIRFEGDYVTIKNFAFQYYNRPFESSGNNNIIDNIYSYSAGNHNPADLGGFSTSFPTGAYLGWGVLLRGNDIEFKNLYVLDAGAEGIKLSNSANPIGRNNTVRCIRGVGPVGSPTAADGNETDYHFLIGSNTSNGRFYNTEVFNNVGMVSPGHGIVSKSVDNEPITGHIFDGFYVLNSKIETQFPNVTNITFKNGQVESSDNDSRRDAHDANIANGSSGIVIENVKFINTAARSRGWDDTYVEVYNEAAQNLLIKNCLFTNDGLYISALAVSFGFPQYLYTTDNWTLDHCTFYNYPRLWEVDKPNTNIQIINSIIVDNPIHSTTRYNDGAGPQGGTTGPFTLNVSYSSVNFFNGFSVSGTNITTVDPLFVDAAGGDFSLQSSSPLISSGVSTAEYSAGLPLGYLGGMGKNNKSTISSGIPLIIMN